MTTNRTAHHLLQRLLADGRIPAEEWPAELGQAEHLGFICRDGAIHVAPNVELISANDIRAAMSERALAWLNELEVCQVLESTNDRLMQLAGRGPIDGSICLAELQTAGRGRRGRAWLSPFAAQLAMSTGVAVGRGMHELGGLSLAVGLALVDCLESLGVSRVELKWPNDIVIDGRKVGGVLIELLGAPARGDPVEVIIGVGLNVGAMGVVHDIIDQAVTDLASEGYAVSRNLLAARLVSCLVDYVKEFDDHGFAPMRRAYDDVHALQGQLCYVAAGDARTSGRVLGVTENGELLLDTDHGARIFGAGEVSLRRVQ